MSDETVVLDFTGVPLSLPPDLEDGQEEVVIPGLPIPDSTALTLDSKLAEQRRPLTLDQLPPQEYEAVKSTWIASGGNVSRTASMHDLTPQFVMKLATEGDWPVYGDGLTSVEKGSRGQLEQAAHRLHKGWSAILESLEVETKEIDEISKGRSLSRYVEPLVARNATFRDLFDRWIKVMERLEPETFGEQSGRDVVSVEGIDRAISDFVANVVVGVADRYKERDQVNGEVIDGEVIDAEIVEESEVDA